MKITELFEEKKYTWSESEILMLYRRAWGSAATDKFWRSWNRANKDRKQEIWDFLEKKAEERRRKSEED